MISNHGQFNPITVSHITFLRFILISSLHLHLHLPILLFPVNSLNKFFSMFHHICRYSKPVSLVWRHGLPSPYYGIQTNVLCIHCASWCQITCFLVTFIVSRKRAFLVCQLFACESCPPPVLTYFISRVIEGVFVCSGLNEVTCATLAGLVSAPESASMTPTGHWKSAWNSWQFNSNYPD